MPKSNKYPLDLGKTMTDQLGGAIPGIPPGKDDGEKYYPQVSLQWDKPYDLPESGEMTVKFKKTSETNSKGLDGKTTQRVELDLTSIESVEAGETEDAEEESTGDRLDKAKKDLEKKSKRKRLPDGDEEVGEMEDEGY